MRNLGHLSPCIRRATLLAGLCLAVSVAAETTEILPPSSAVQRLAAAKVLLARKPTPQEFGKGYWIRYKDGGLVEAAADPVERKMVGWTFQNEPRDEADACVILYREKDAAVWFSFPSEPKRLFADSDDVDLQTLCFGQEPTVAATWERLAGAPVQYAVAFTDATGDRGKQDASFVLTCDSPLLSVDEIVRKAPSPELANYEASVKRIRERKEKFSANLDKKLDSFERVVNLLREIDPIMESIAHYCDLIENIPQRVVASEARWTASGRVRSRSTTAPDEALLRQYEAAINQETLRLRAVCRDVFEEHRVTMPLDPFKLYEQLQKIFQEYVDSAPAAKNELEKNQRELAKAEAEKREFEEGPARWNVARARMYQVRPVCRKGGK